MNIAFLWPWDKAHKILPNWRDGHRAAIEELGKIHTVDWYLGKDALNVPENYDFYLIWDDGSSPAHQNIKGRKGLMLTTDNTVTRISPHDYDVIYCESQPVYDLVRQSGMRAIKAMGTDIEFFSPEYDGKDIEYFYPATFSPWKRQSSIAFLGPDLLCVGTVQPDGSEELKACLESKVKVEIGYYPVEKIRDYYKRAVRVEIPSIHGSERTVLEAMSCDILPSVNKDNKKAYSYVQEFMDSEIPTPREFVIKNYSQFEYTKNLLKGME